MRHSGACLAQQPGVEFFVEGVWQAEQLCLATLPQQPPKHILRRCFARVQILSRICSTPERNESSQPSSFKTLFQTLSI